tara:strand:- start:109 stop:885 length:777 start_codon:yes stop_codon:yes gene_type:complete
VDVLENLPDEVPQGKELVFHETVVDLHRLEGPVVASVALLAVLILFFFVRVIIFLIALFVAPLFICCFRSLIFARPFFLTTTIAVTEVLLQLETPLLQVEDDVVHPFVEDRHVGADGVEFFLRGFQALLYQLVDDLDVVRELLVTLNVWHQQVGVFQLEQGEHDGVDPIDLLEGFVHVQNDLEEVLVDGVKVWPRHHFLFFLRWELARDVVNLGGYQDHGLVPQRYEVEVVHDFAFLELHLAILLEAQSDPRVGLDVI